jgi:hypothetical protein
VHYIFDRVTWSGIGHFLSAALTPVIGLIAVYIARQQYLINRRQHRLALFEKRLAVFNSTMRMIGAVLENADATLQQCMKFIQETRDHDFLFGPEVGEYINKVYKKGTELHAHTTMGASRAAQQTEVVDWFLQQTKEARKIFLPYLDFSKQ